MTTLKSIECPISSMLNSILPFGVSNILISNVILVTLMSLSTTKDIELTKNAESFKLKTLKLEVSSSNPHINGGFISSISNCDLFPNREFIFNSL